MRPKIPDFVMAAVGILALVGIILWFILVAPAIIKLF